MDKNIPTTLRQLLVTQAQLRQQNRVLATTDEIVEPERQQLQTARDELELQIAEEIANLLNLNHSLQQQQRQWQALFDSALDAILIADDQGAYVDVNPAACKLFGMSKEDLLHSKVADFAAPHLDIEQMWQQFLVEGQMSGEFCLHRRDGTTRQTEFSAIANFLPGRHLSILRDLTEKKQLEEQFYRAQRLESLGILASGIAHDLNNILTPILAVAQLLPRKFPNLDERTQELLITLENSAKQGAEMVKQILLFGRGDGGKRVILPVLPLLNKVVQIAKSTFPKNIEITMEPPEQEPWLISADKTQLNQVLLNLLVNARDAMPNGGSLTVSVRNLDVDENYARMNLVACPGSYVVVEVTDTGTGIPPEIKKHIFDPFFTTKDPGIGTGLGLATVIGIIKNHGGFVRVETQVGQGSQF